MSTKTDKIKVGWRDGNFNYCGSQLFDTLEEAEAFVIENNEQSGYVYFIDD